MKHFNSITLLGNLGQDPKTGKTKSGKDWASFSIATERNWKKDDEWQSEVTWHNCMAMGYAVKPLSEAKKGQTVLIVGSYKKSSKEDSGMYVEVQDVRVFDSAPKSEEQSEGPAGDSDDLPF